ncbi:hypothetical protein [Epilithonimonas sp.]|uniref:hypothetical protein n=1 Tax=Epilithonimonas sp. TaxID=2894511 RepID=UPI00289F3C99|nr:hypothetical protein [Epilithonimonas sp.]
MNHFLRFLVFIILIPNLIFSQDGSDIQYVKSSNLNKELIGKFVHFDFYNKSFLAQKGDTIELNIDQKIIKFIEVRKDNGHNNWFSQQSLISEDKKLQISKFQIRIFDDKKIYVTAFLDHLKNNKIVKSELVNLFIPRNKIVEILVDSKQADIIKILSYAAIGCTCAQWFDKNTKGENEYFYLEPLNKNLVNANKLWDGNNLPLTVKVTGNLISENDYPEYFTKQYLYKGGEKEKIFRYNKIVVLKK